jgi:hypothetical protein
MYGGINDFHTSKEPFNQRDTPKNPRHDFSISLHRTLAGDNTSSSIILETPVPERLSLQQTLACTESALPRLAVSEEVGSNIHVPAKSSKHVRLRPCIEGEDDLQVPNLTGISRRPLHWSLATRLLPPAKPLEHMDRHLKNMFPFVKSEWIPRVV